MKIQSSISFAFAIEHFTGFSNTFLLVIFFRKHNRIKLFAGEKSMFKYRLNADNISDPSCCSSSGMCLDCILWGFKSPLGLGCFSAFFTFQLHV